MTFVPGRIAASRSEVKITYVTGFGGNADDLWAIAMLTDFKF